MKQLPSEVVYVLLFMAFMLVQFLTQRGKQAAADKEAQAEAERAAPVGEADAPAPVDDVARPSPAPIAQPAQSRPASAASLATSAQAERMRIARSSLATGTTRRYSRQSLFGDKRRTQDAVVVATILGPCRGFEPYENGP